MLVQDIMDISSASLPILKLAGGEYHLNEAAGIVPEEGNIIVVDEKGRLLGKINRRHLFREPSVHELRSLVEPLKEVILLQENALELLDYFKDGRKKIVYVVGQDKKLCGAVSSGSRAVRMLFKIKNFAPFPNIFDAMYEAIIVIDAGGTIIYVNHAYSNIVGVPAGKILGKKMAEVEPTSMCLKVLKGHPPILNQKILIESIGVEVLANITPFYVHGKLAGVISVFRNIYETMNLSDELKRVRDIARYLHDELNAKDKQLPGAFESLVGKNRYFRQALILAATVAPTDATVMIRGESGVGKEVLAEAIHKSSPRKDFPFIKVNCAAIPESLLESELFGYEEGAFTGAKKGGMPGKFELAHKGTIFLDEVGDMSPAMQAKLLRVLQEKAIEKIGGRKTVYVDARIISATNKDLETMVVNKQFREDLYYRLNVIPIFLPPLRRRKDDLPLLADHFLKLYCDELKREKIIIASEVMNIFLEHEWPGNIRELKNVIEHAAILCSGNMITVEHLPWYLKKARADFHLPVWRKETLPELVEKLEKEVITRVLQEYGNKSSAIKALGISRRTFYLKLKKYRLEMEN